MNLVVLVPYVSKSLPIATYPALQLLLLRQLQEVICLRSDVVTLDDLSTTLKIEIGLLPDREPKSQLSLQRIRGKLPILYSSAIALRLAKPCHQPALALATAIADPFLTGAIAQTPAPTSSEPQAFEVRAAILRNFTVKVVPPGWLYFELASSGLAAWLQLLTQIDQRILSQKSNLVSPVLTSKQAATDFLVLSSSHVFDSFSVQYAHARCCALLRLARDQNLSLGNLSDSNAPQLAQAIAQPFPWLNSQGELRLRHPAEHSLIFALIDTVDELSRLEIAAIAQSPSQDWRPHVEKLAAALAQAFLTFYAACRFWGEVQREDPDLVQARLGLVSATQHLLQFILQDWLGLVAPTEL